MRKNFVRIFFPTSGETRQRCASNFLPAGDEMSIHVKLNDPQHILLSHNLLMIKRVTIAFAFLHGYFPR